MFSQCCQIFLNTLGKPFHQPLPSWALWLHNFFFLDLCCDARGFKCGDGGVELSGKPAAQETSGFPELLWEFYIIVVGDGDVKHGQSWAVCPIIMKFSHGSFCRPAADPSVCAIKSISILNNPCKYQNFFLIILHSCSPQTSRFTVILFSQKQI